MSLAQEVPDFLAVQAALRPADIAMEVVREGRQISYAQLSRRADAAAHLLRRHGIDDGQRVAVLCRNRPEFFELLFACARAGAILVPLNWRMTPGELDQVLADCTPALLICGSEDEALVRALASSPSVLFLDRDYEAGLESGPAAPLRRSHMAGDIWYLMYTSGTTGVPKGVIYTFGMALANYVNLANAVGLTSADVTLNYLPLFHTAGINLHTLPTLIAGGSVLVLDRFDPEQVVQLLESERISAFFGVPTIYKDLLDHPRFAAAPLDRVRHWTSGGAPLPARISERFRMLGLRLCNGMGMTETGPIAFLQQPANAWEQMGSVGKPQLLCQVRIVDTHGREAEVGEIGEIMFAGPNVTPGYWNRPPIAGWLASGDAGYRDADGFFHVAGRRSDMFVSGGENVWLHEVESVLADHPDVDEAIVTPRADPRWGEVGHALLKASRAGTLNLRDVQAFCQGKLAAYKIPKTFEQVDELPRTASGKLKRLARIAEEAA